MDTSKIKVLVVDDEEDIRTALKGLFSALHFNIRTASSGNEAWEFLRIEPAHIVITDVRMANGTGIDLLDKIKSKDVNFPKVLLISGFTDYALDEVYHLGADGLFNKPFRWQEIRTAVEKAFLSKRLLWSKKPQTQPVTDIRKSIGGSADSSEVNFGRGGFFFKFKSDYLSVNDVVSFSLDFNTGGSVKKISGLGEVRWTRTENTKELPAGLGVEIAYIDKSSRDKFCEWLQNLKVRPYIPRK